MAGLLGALGLVRQAVWRAGNRGKADLLGFRVLLIGMPFVILVLGMVDIAWDDFAFWVPNLLHLCETWHFPTLARPAAYSSLAAYPYGGALPGFAVHLLGGQQVDTVAFVWNLLAMLAACAAFANVIAMRLRTSGQTLSTGALWSVAALAVLLVGMGNPTFIAKNLLTNMGDSATGAGLGVICALLFEWTEAPAGAPERARILTEISLSCCAVVFIRQANPALLTLLLLSAALSLMLFQDKLIAPAVAKLASTSIMPVFIWYSWTRYADIEIPGGRHYLLAWQDWHWSVFGSTLAAASHVLILKSGYTAMAVGMACIAARVVLRRVRSGNVHPMPQERVASAVLATAVTGLTFGNIAFLLFCYLGTNFGVEEARQAITFWRFISQTGDSLMVGFACIVPVRWIAPLLRRTSVQRLLPVAALLVPIVAVSTYRDDLTSPVPRLRTIADNLQRSLPDSRPIILLDLSGNGFAPLVVKYQMTAVDGDRRLVSVVADPHGIPPARARELHFPSGTYVWLAEGSPGYGNIFGTPTNAGCSYLFDNYAEGFHQIAHWEIGRYRWTTSAIASQVSGQSGEGVADSPARC
jgi:hypothetical protein